jgi:DNA (cytosine-5)-methyltransferase 1
MLFSCVDTFSGAGGLSLGLSRAGYKILLSFDIDKLCIETLKNNPKYFSHNALCEDIANMLDGKMLKLTGCKRGELFLLAGGPPCQGFSVERIGEDTVTRNELVLLYGRLIEEVYPMFFIMENVSGIQGKRGKQILNQLTDHMGKVGYNIHKQLVDASDFSVPQRRKRIIIVGERKDIGSGYTFPKSCHVKKTVRETIEFLPPPPENGKPHSDFPLHRRDKLSDVNLRRIRALKQGQGRDFLPAELLADCHKVDSAVIGHRNVYGRMKWDDVAPTITARFDSFTRGLFGHPEQDRSISLCEGALIQTFPLDYVFAGNKVDIARQIGNAVPPNLAQIIGESIINYYSEKR